MSSSSCLVWLTTVVIVITVTSRHQGAAKRDKIDKTGPPVRGGGTGDYLISDECTPDYKKYQCGKDSATQLDCRLMSCCWDPAKAPHCFLSKRMVRTECLVKDDVKTDCGYYGITEGECLMRDCCWAPAPHPHTPPCFHKHNVRLVDGDDERSGRVEVYYDKQWGSVCNDYFNIHAAIVVCRSLGYLGGHPHNDGRYGEGTGEVLLDDVVCDGTELNIVECKHGPWGQANCAHSEDAGVSCWNKEPSAIPPGYNTTVRLVGGPDERAGRVEIYYRGMWGTVCDDEFGPEEAQVVCRTLGFQGGIAKGSAVYGDGDAEILLDDMRCRGNESRLEDCERSKWSFHDCDHSEDAGVFCGDEERVISSVRLVDGPDIWSGRLEILHDGEWGTVCDDDFGADEAQVVCRMLHFVGGEANLDGLYGLGSGVVWLDHISCGGSEDSLNNCSVGEWEVESCGLTEDVGVDCSDPNNEVRVRLAGGDGGSSAGRVELFVNGNWGTVCNDGFDIQDATVLCRMLHFERGIPRLSLLYGAGSGTILVNELDCTGWEQSVLECDHNPWLVHDCHHEEDVGVQCVNELVVTESTVDPAVRLVAGVQYGEGMLQVLHDGEWGTICQDHFTPGAFIVVCQNFGFNLGVQTENRNDWVDVLPPIMLSNVSCTGRETKLSQCSYEVWGEHDCDHDGDIWIECCDEDPDDELDDEPDEEAEDEAEDVEDEEDVSVVKRSLPDDDSRVRLVNNGLVHPTLGRLEVYHQDAWGTVCDDGFTWKAATVVCRMLHHGNAALSYGVVRRHEYFGVSPSTAPILLDDVVCSGEESSLFYCRHQPWGENNCVHGEDVGVQCGKDARGCLRGGGECSVSLFKNEEEVISDSDVPEGQESLRLMDSGVENTRTGRVEVYHNGEWGSICDADFTQTEAQVICRQLGHKYGWAMKSHDSGTGSVRIWLGHVTCTGFEAHIWDCAHRGWGEHNCLRRDHIAVHCASELRDTYPAESSSSSSVRLVDGPALGVGRVELLHDGLWGTVCNDGFSNILATVVCRELGYDDGVVIRGTSGDQMLKLDGVRCRGTETRLEDCAHNGWGTHKCDHEQDVSVHCHGFSSKPKSRTKRTGDGGNSLRLVNDRDDEPNCGRIEVFHDGVWGTVCDDEFGRVEAAIVCTQLGYRFGWAKKAAFYGEGTGQIWLDNVQCTGTEAYIWECTSRGWGQHNCLHAEDVGVQCANGVRHTYPPRDSASLVRLSDGPMVGTGRVEIFHNNQWGTVCDDQFGHIAASVVCREIGYLEGFVISGLIGAPGQEIWLDGVSCTGTEALLEDCDHNEWGSHNCEHEEDVSVKCIREELPQRSTVDDIHDLRLVDNGVITNQAGRLEVLHNGEWGTVCNDKFGQTDAQIVCEYLGYRYGWAKPATDYGLGTGQIWLDNVECAGSEANLWDCEHLAWGLNNCAHSEDIAVLCANVLQETVPPSDAPQDLRLKEGPYSGIGRVEVFGNGVWGTVCDDGFSDNAITVLCKQLGYDRGIQIGGILGTVDQVILLDDVACQGTEARLHDCQHNGLGRHNCVHEEDVSVQCYQAKIGLR